MQRGNNKNNDSIIPMSVDAMLIVSLLQQSFTVTDQSLLQGCASQTNVAMLHA